MSLNCRSISAKFDEFKLFVDDLMNHNCNVDIINLQESWLSDSAYYNDFIIPGYDLHMQPYIYTLHGGLITYIKSTPKMTILNGVYQQSDHWEACFFQLII